MSTNKDDNATVGWKQSLSSINNHCSIKKEQPTAPSAVGCSFLVSYLSVDDTKDIEHLKSKVKKRKGWEGQPVGRVRSTERSEAPHSPTPSVARGCAQKSPMHGFQNVSFTSIDLFRVIRPFQWLQIVCRGVLFAN